MKTLVPKTTQNAIPKVKEDKKKMADKKVFEKQHVDTALVEKAVTALLKHHVVSLDASKSLLGTDVPLQVQFGLEVAPGRSQPKPIRLQIPHPMHKLSDTDTDDVGNLEEPEVCLIVKEDSKAAVQDMIAKFPVQMGCIKKVLGLQSLRNKHAEFKQRRDLLARFTVFMADDRILPMLTSALGKDFLAAKKQPIPVRISRKEALPFAIQKALSATYLHIPEGTCITVRAGNTAMSIQKLVQNVVAVCESVAPKIPRKWANVRSISIKLPATTALPVYNKTPAELLEIASMAGLTSAWKTADEEAAEQLSRQQEAAKEKADDRKRKTADKSPLLRALKKQKQQETKGNDEKDSSPAAKKSKKETKPADAASSKNKRKQSVDKTEVKKKDDKEKTKEVEAKVESSGKKDDKPPAEKNAKKDDKVADDKPAQKKAKKDDKHAEKQKKDDKPSADKKAKKNKSSAEKQQANDDKPSSEKDKKQQKSEDSSFIAAKKFTGSKKGYVFKKGEKGVGYYVDVKPVVDKMAMEAIAKMQSRPKQSGSRKSAGGGGGKRRRGR
jgi:ribosome biogenesis protein UTP30